MAGYIPGFDVVRYDAKGFMHRVTGGTVTLYNETASTSIGTRAISSDGIVAMGSITGSVGDVVRVSHGSYAGTVQFTLTATQDEAFTTTDNAAATFVVEDLRSTTTQTDAATAYLIDLDNPNVKPRRLGVFKADATTLIPLDQAAVEKNYRVKWVSRDQNFADTGFNLGTAPSEDVTVPAFSVGASVTLASEAEVLAGTEATKLITPEVLAALWVKGSDIASASTITVGDGGFFNVTGTTTITDIDPATDRAGRLFALTFASSLILTHGANLWLAGSKNITTAAGDIAFFRSYGSDVVKLEHYQRAVNFPRTQKEVYLEQYGFSSTGMAAAITAIGSTRCNLVIDQDWTATSSHTTVATTNVVYRNGAKVTLSGGVSVTHNRFEDPGSVQVVSGVDASNHFLFGAGAVRNGRYNIAWYLGIGSTSDATYPMTDIITSIGTNGGGIIYGPAGSWKLNNITLPDYVIVEGDGQGQDSGGTRWLARDSSTAYIFRSYRNFRNHHIQNCVLDTAGYTTTYPWKIEGTSGYSGFGVTGKNVTFYSNGAIASSCYPQLSVQSDAAYEVVGGLFENCQWITANGSKAFYCDSINTQFTFVAPRVISGSGDSYGFDFYRCGYPVVINPDFRGQAGSYVTPATSIGTVTGTISTSGTTLTAVSGTYFTEAMRGARVFKSGGVDAYIIDLPSTTTATLSTGATSGFTAQTVNVYKTTVPNTSRGGTCIRFGDIAVGKVDGGQEESYNYFLKIIGVGYDRPIHINNVRIQDHIEIDGSCSLYMDGNYRYSNCFSDTAGTSAHIHSNDTVYPTLVTNSAITLTKSNDWGPNHAGSSVFRMNTGYKTGLFQQEIEYFTRILDTSGAALTRPLFEVATTYEASGVTGQLLQRWSLYDACKNFLYGLSLYRDDPNVNPGYWIWKTTQSHPYNGALFGFVTGYSTDVKADVTQTTSRTATVSANGATGIITLYTYASTVLEAGESIAFTFNNTYIKNGCDFRVEVIDGASSTLTKAWSSDWGGNAATIRVMNLSQTTDENGSAIKLKYRIEADGGQAGIVP